MEVIASASTAGKCSRRGYSQLDALLGRLRRLYNDALAERRDAWEKDRTTISLYDQFKSLTVQRKDKDHAAFGIPTVIARGPLRRVHNAYSAFFRRCREAAGGKAAKPGYPRFKSFGQYETIDVPQVPKGAIRRRRSGYVLCMNGLPRIRFHLSRALPEDCRLKMVKVIRRNMRGVELRLVYATRKTPLAPSGNAVGIDLGVRDRVYTSDGETLDSETADKARLGRMARAISRCKGSSRGEKPSNTRRKRQAARRRSERRRIIRRRNASHRFTTQLVRENGLIAAEKLRQVNMVRSARGTAGNPGVNVAQKRGLNRSIQEQAWGEIRWQLSYKAAWAGREYVEVDPRNTSRTCSRCGNVKAKLGARKTYRCGGCGHVQDRDWNAAANILAAGAIAAGAGTWGDGPGVAPELYAKAA